MIPTVDELPRWAVPAPPALYVEIEPDCEVSNVVGWHCERCQERAVQLH